MISGAARTPVARILVSPAFVARAFRLRVASADRRSLWRRLVQARDLATAVLLVAIFGLASHADAQQGPTALRILKVRGNVSVIQGAGGNITVLTFPEGVTLVDSGTAEMADQVLAAIRTLSTQPIRYIINTHVHSDHVGGNLRVGGTGRQITGGNVTGQ